MRFFDDLPPVMPDELIGLWKGCGIMTGHPLDGILENLGWYGKRFNPDLRADALLFQMEPRRLVPIDPGLIPLKLAFRFPRFGRTRIARNWFTYLQKGLRATAPIAALTPRSFRGKVSAAMIYDRQPITDYFRQFDEETVIGAMALEGDNRLYFFRLSRA
ncbi:GXWXG domain-containing protein [Neorhizobium sp. DT-125]